MNKRGFSLLSETITGRPKTAVEPVTEAQHQNMLVETLMVAGDLMTGTTIEVLKVEAEINANDGENLAESLTGFLKNTWAKIAALFQQIVDLISSFIGKLTGDGKALKEDIKWIKSEVVTLKKYSFSGDKVKVTVKGWKYKEAVELAQHMLNATNYNEAQIKGTKTIGALGTNFAACVEAIKSKNMGGSKANAISDDTSDIYKELGTGNEATNKILRVVANGSGKVTVSKDNGDLAKTIERELFDSAEITYKPSGDKTISALLTTIGEVYANVDEEEIANVLEKGKKEFTEKAEEWKKAAANMSDVADIAKDNAKDAKDNKELDSVSDAAQTLSKAAQDYIAIMNAMTGALTKGLTIGEGYHKRVASEIKNALKAVEAAAKQSGTYDKNAQ
ncbi:MAG: hypothetical protein ACRC92_26070 [Peptostreptococcaceae bacterium]